jgi:hypothetical protein
MVVGHARRICTVWIVPQSFTGTHPTGPFESGCHSFSCH